MNGPVGRRSVATAVTIAAIARLMTYAFPATVTTYKGLVPPLCGYSTIQSEMLVNSKTKKLFYGIR
jgi:hypothetical protein